MKIRDTKKEINIYINSRDHAGTVPVYKLLIDKFISIDVTGCTVLKSTAGYGTELNVKYPDEFIHNFWSKEATIVLRVIESETKVEEIIKLLDVHLPKGMVTIKDVEYIRYTKNIITDEDIRLADSV
jgi:PII-like signaling protein